MSTEYAPLADKLRPIELKDFVGQNHLMSDNGIITILIRRNKPLSLLFYGPPGSGKTTLANILVKKFSLPVLKINGVSFSTPTFKKIAAETHNQSLYIIIDEIHRMNKAQQDALLPFVENGTIFIIGTTTENPSFEINNALLSRMTIAIFNQLDENNIETILLKGADYLNIKIRDHIIKGIIKFSNMDARQALNILDTISTDIDSIDNHSQLKSILNKKFIPYDKSGKEHYNLISAMHKAIRGSDVNASLYYFARMLKGGENPIYIGRRLIRIASEDIGNADHEALGLAINAFQAYQILGSPEGELALAQCVIYLSLCPKSVSTYNAYNDALKDADEFSHMPVPLKLRNAPTKLMKEMGYSNNYRYPPKYPNSYISEKYFPDDMKEKDYYKPVMRGFEREMKKRMDYFKKLRHELKEKD